MITKFLLSFLKRAWKARDYPLRYARIDDASGQLGSWHVEIEGWRYMMGFGDSREEALRDLQGHLDAHVRKGQELRRPGVDRDTLSFGSTQVIDSHPDTARRLITEVLDPEWECGDFVSDEATLWEFTEDDSLDRVHEAIRREFGVDVSDIEDHQIGSIIKRLEAAKQADR